MDRIIYDLINTNIIQLFNNPTIFYPSSLFDVETNISSVIKFGLYASLIIILLTNNFKLAILIIIFIILLTIYSRKSVVTYNNISNANFLENNKCRKSTIDNPTANALLYTEQDELNYKMCANQDDDIDKNIKHNFYFDSHDLWFTRNNMRPFITMPSQTHPNDIDKFTSYLYNFKAPTCKTDALNCVFNDDVRYHKTNFIDKKV